jgi:hypothetical protein
VLADAGIAAVGLLDAVEVAEHARGVWEPRLHPWRDAVCVAPDRVPRALTALAGVPGAILISDEDDGGDLPAGLQAAPGWARSFLAELAERVTAPADPPGTVSGTVVDAGLNVTIVGGFPHPTTGRAALVAALRRRLGDAEQEARAAGTAAGLAAEREEVAAGDLDVARAAHDYAETTERLRQLEQEQLPAAKLRVQQHAERRQELGEAYTRARAEETALEAARERAERNRRAAEEQLAAARAAAADVQRSLDGMDLAYWLVEFGGGEHDARAALNWDGGPLQLDPDRGHARPTGLADPTQDLERRTRDTLRNRANDRLTAIVTLLDIDRQSGTGSPTPEIAEAVRQREHLADSAGTPLGRDEIGFTGLAQAVDSWLIRYADRDLLAQEQIRTARQQREAEIGFAETKLAGMQAGLANIQDSLEQRVEAPWPPSARRCTGSTSPRTASAPNWTGSAPPGRAGGHLDLAGGAEMAPLPGGRMLRYDNATNSAQEKLAALLASPNPQGRVLILDELGDSLGDEHRRDVLSAVASVAAEYGITMLGTCQDAVMPDAAAYCGEVLYFSYPSKAEALNQPTRMFGFDPDRNRVEVTAEALLAGRPWT